MRALLIALLLAPLTTAQDPPRVLTGLDVLVRDDFRQLEGARVGLITNHTGLDHRGIPILDLMLRSELIEVVAVFAPEHGFRGRLEGNVADAVHEGTRLPIYSLYGKTRKPTPAMLEGIDTLVFDIQDIGCRFYTYISTMGLAMEAAAAAGIRLVILDRPNPLGGLAVEGPVLDEGRESFVGFHTLPVRHGMTVGELARMFRTERGVAVDLKVIPMAGWQRSMLFEETEQYWVNPSPNMRCLTQALLYPGVGLLETTNLSVGRGTDTPFEVVGAPWIDGRLLARRLNEASPDAVRFVPTRFVPTTSKFEGKRCEGVNIIITHRDRFEPLRCGMLLATTLRDLYPERWDVARYDRLLGDAPVLEALKKTPGPSVTELTSLWQRDLKAFRKRREAFLIYP